MLDIEPYTVHSAAPLKANMFPGGEARSSLTVEWDRLYRNILVRFVSPFTSVTHVYDHESIDDLIAVLKGNRNVNAAHPAQAFTAYDLVHSVLAVSDDPIAPHMESIYTKAEDRPEFPMIIVTMDFSVRNELVLRLDRMGNALKRLA